MTVLYRHIRKIRFYINFHVCIDTAVNTPMCIIIIESVDSINRDERGFPLTQYITNGGISSARNTSTHFKHNHRVLRLISNRMSVYNSVVYVRAARSKKSPFGVLLLLLLLLILLLLIILQ